MSKKTLVSLAVIALRSGVALSALVVSGVALAQVPERVRDPKDPQTAVPGDPAEDASTPGQADPAVDEDEIIITGTQIRGIEPVGSPVIAVSQQDVVATGATTANQLLTNIPQIATFNDLPILGTGGNSTQLSVIRPRIRNIGGNDAGASATLILVDGHRVVGAGLRQTTADPDIVPPGALERVEIIPDGGSSIYGADAVGGVINFITRRRFSGVQVDAKYGFADDYYQIDAYVTAGHDWGTGSAYITYNFAKADEILGIDRDFVRRFDFTNNVQPDLTCSPGNVSVGGGNYALPGRVRNTFNRCDTSDLQTFFPNVKRHSVFGAVSQDFGESIKFDLRGFFTRRVSTFNTGPFRQANATISPANPYYVNIPTVPGGPTTSNRPQQVNFSWEPVLGTESGSQETALDEWGITPSITVDLSSKWQFRGMLNYGRSTTEVTTAALNNTLLTAALAGTTFQTAINPYDIAATQNQQLITNIANWENFAQNKQRLLNLRAIVDGTLFTIPGGEVRLAAGAEFLKESVAPRSGNVVPGNESSLVGIRASRNIKALFGELFIPLRGPDNNGPGMHSLSVSLSGRYDDYSDFGSTFNPKIGATWEPLDWVKFRGAWGTSFNAPSLADTTGSPDGGIGVLAAVFVPFLSNPFQPPNPARGANQPILNVTGAFPGTRPQSAETVSLGMDVRPPFIPGLSASLTYYAVDFKDQISLPPVANPVLFYSQFTNLYIMYPTRAQVEEFARLFPTGLETIAGLYDPGDPDVYILLDARRRNLGRLKVSGLDFNVNYTRATGFGSIDASFAGTYELNRETQAFPSVPFVNVLAADNSRFRFAATAGATIGNLRAQATWNHTHGYDLTPLASLAFQDKVGSFNVINLFFRYDVKGEDLLKDLSFTLNINNVLDQDPPLLKGFNFSGQGYTNGSTLGRLIQFGVSKKF